jgi:4-hydroxybenzoate polyprenyltransferase
MSKASVYLRLGRVSNLPTVWSNVVAGMLLAGAGQREGPGGAPPEEGPAPLTAVIFGVAISLCYVAGMFLNDFFDREIDARERPERPIPSGQVSAAEVLMLGTGMMAVAMGLLGTHTLVASGASSGLSILGGLALCGAIVLYNVWHKGNVLSPLLMGACRVLVYVTVALGVTGGLGAPLLAGATVLLSYLIGLSYVAKQENLTEFKNLWPLLFLFAPFLYGLPALTGGIVGALVYVGFFAWVLYAISFLRRRGPGHIPRAVVSLIAGLSLLDALLIARLGSSVWACVAGFAFLATIFFQRYVRGT